MNTPATVTLHPHHLVSRLKAPIELPYPVALHDLMPLMWETVDLSDDFTLRGLVSLIDDEAVPVLRVLLGENVAAIVAEARKSPTERPFEADYLKVYNVFYERLAREFDAWGDWQQPYDDVGTKGSISLSFAAVPRLLDLPLRYDPQLVFENERGEVAFETTTTITLLELLKAIFWELTFFGSPEERDAQLAEVSRRLWQVSAEAAREEPNRESEDP